METLQTLHGTGLTYFYAESTKATLLSNTPSIRDNHSATLCSPNYDGTTYSTRTTRVSTETTTTARTLSASYQTRHRGSSVYTSYSLLSVSHKMNGSEPEETNRSVNMRTSRVMKRLRVHLSISYVQSDLNVILENTLEIKSVEVEAFYKITRTGAYLRISQDWALNYEHFGISCMPIW